MSRLISALLILLFWPAAALADPVTFVASVLTAGFTQSVAATVTSFLIRTAVAVAINAVATRLMTPKIPGGTDERQASVTTISLGEAPREVLFGRVCTAGSLVDAFNFGGEHGTDWECLVIALADHQIDALEGFYVGDTYYPYTADGGQAAFSDGLDLEFFNASETEGAPARMPAPDWTETDTLHGVARIWVAYFASPDIWPQGRPTFRFVIRGKRCYDPRKDSTAGGSGAHRWNDPSTWEWTQNAAVCRYNWVRGIYALDRVDQAEQLLIGRGLSALEAPPENVIAPANVCDELVDTAEGPEPRYRVGGVIRSTDSFDMVEEMFAAAMAGTIVQRDGGVEIEPGQAKAVVASITDGDLITGAAVIYSDFLPDPERVNTIVPRYIEPSQLWKPVSAAVLRDQADIDADGGSKESPLNLDLVTWATQAQRCGEIERLLGRKERRATLTLGPRFAWLEEGDWISWTSSRHPEGGLVRYRVERYRIAENRQITLSLREISATVYGEMDAPLNVVPFLPVPGLDPLVLADVDITNWTITGENGDVTPAVKASWATPVDPGMRAVRLELRKVGETQVASSLASNPAAGEMITTNGVPSAGELEGRLVPVGEAGRRVTASPWLPVTSDGLILAAISAALSDGALTPGEKLIIVPQIQALVDSRVSMRGRADAVNALYTNNLARVAYEDGADALDAVLAAWTAPVAWDDASDTTTVPDPAAFTAAFRAAMAGERWLQNEVTQLWANRIADIDAQIVDLADDGVLTPAEKMLIIPHINGAIAARAQLRASADALSLFYGVSAARTAFEDAASTLDGILAGITSPIPWNNYTDKSVLADAAAFRSAWQAHITTGLDLQSAIDAAADAKANGLSTDIGTLQAKTFYMDASGRIFSHLALPQNAVTGNAAYKTVWPFVPYATAMRVNGFTEYRTGGNIFFPTGDIYGLSPGTPYDFFWSYPANSFIAVDLAFSFNFLVEAEHYVYVGRQMTLAADGGPPPDPDPLPPGFGGGGAPSPFYFHPIF